MSKGSNSSTTSTAPNQAAMSQYYDLLNKASSVASTPYQGYGGETTAGINGQQQQGFANINGIANTQNQFTQQGGQSITAGSAPVSAQDIQHYYDPYTQKVIDATQADFDVQNQRAQSQTTGNAAAQGALGGNRVGVAQALTAEGQQRVQAPVIAGLQSAGYQNALTAAQTDKNRQISGGQALSGIGSAGLSAANAQVGAGTLEQQTQQAQDTAAQQEFFRQQAYPFQTTQWQAGIDTGVGSQLGGTSSTQGPEPNQFAQAAGLGLTAAGMFLRDGGRVRGFAGGGAMSDSPWGGVQSWVPTIGITAGSGAPKPPQLPGQQQNGMNSPGAAKGVAALGKAAKGWFGNSDGSGQSLDDMATDRSVSQGSQPDTNWVPAWGDNDPNASVWARGGGVSGRRGYADAGYVEPMSGGFGGGSVIDMTDEPPFRIAPYSDADRAADDRALGLVAKGPVPDRASGVAASNLAIPRDEATGVPIPVQTTSYRKPEGVAAPDGGIADRAGKIFDQVMPGADDQDAMSYAPRSRGVSAPAMARPMVPAGVASAPPQSAAAPADNRSMIDKILHPNLSDEARQGLISMGLGMMANRRGGAGSFLSSVGEGGEQGMQTYASAKAATAAGNLKQQERADTKESEALKLAQAKFLHESMTPYQKAQLARENLTPVGTNDDGFPVYLDRRSGKEVVGATRLQQKAPIGYVRNPDGTMAPVRGGPADPDQIKAVATAKQTGAALGDDTADWLAERVLAGDAKALTNLGRGAQGAENIIKIQTLAAKKAAERGMNANDVLAKVAEQSGLTAQQRTFGTQVARMAVNSTEAQGAIELGKAASAAVPRTSWVPVNKAVQAFQTGTSNKELAQFGAANMAIINTYSRAISPTGTPTVHDKEHAEKLLSTATSHDTYLGVLDQMNKEIEIAHAAPMKAKEEMERIRKGTVGGDHASPKPAAAVPNAAPPDAAIARLRADPSLGAAFEQKYGVPAAKYLGQ